MGEALAKLLGEHRLTYRSCFCGEWITYTAKNDNDARRQHDQHIANVLLASKLVVSREQHDVKVKREVDWQHHWLDKFERADLERSRLERLLDVTAVERTQDVVRTLDAVPGQKSAKHGEDCWRRHTGCLARRIHTHLFEPRAAS